jgi:hypothetical protein
MTMQHEIGLHAASLDAMSWFGSKLVGVAVGSVLTIGDLAPLYAILSLFDYFEHIATINHSSRSSVMGYHLALYQESPWW